MIDSQLRTSGVMDRDILSAMADIPREIFVAEHRRPVAYVDDLQPLPFGRFLLSPSRFARMAQLAKISVSDRVLDIGTGTGYSAAVLARQGREIVATEHVAELAKVAKDNLAALGVSNVSVLDDDASDAGLFDVIVVEGALDHEPADYFSLLASGGRLVAPVLKRGVALIGTYLKTEQGVMFTSAFDATMPRLRNDISNDVFTF